MGLTRTTRGLDSGVYDDYSSDVSDSYDGLGSTYYVSGGNLVSSGTDYVVRTTPSGIACLTASIYVSTTLPQASGVALWANGAFSADADIDGYAAQTQTSLGLYRWTNRGPTALGSSSSDLLATAGAFFVQRIYRSGNNICLRWGNDTTAFDQLLSASDTTYTSGLYGGFRPVGNYVVATWADFRPSHTVTCTGMTEGHYLRVTDGTTAAEAAANGAGLATVDAGAVLFPLATVQIRTAAAGGGDLIAELDTGDYADMGGGDAFAYSASGLWLPQLIKPQYFPQFGGLTYG